MLIRKNASNLRISGVFLCVVLNLANCQHVDDNNVSLPQNSTFTSSLLNSVASCWSNKSPIEDRGSCLKSKLYKICQHFLRNKLLDSLSKEERVELMRYQPVVSKMFRIFENESDSTWLDTKISNQLRLLFDEIPDDDNEGRKKKNKGMGQIIMMSVASGFAVMIPLFFKAIFLMAVKALVAGKLAIILSTLSHFSKSSHHDHDSVHETSLRRQTIIQ